MQHNGRAVAALLHGSCSGARCFRSTQHRSRQSSTHRVVARNSFIGGNSSAAGLKSCYVCLTCIAMRLATCWLQHVSCCLREGAAGCASARLCFSAHSLGQWPRGSSTTCAQYTPRSTRVRTSHRLLDQGLAVAGLTLVHRWAASHELHVDVLTGLGSSTAQKLFEVMVAWCGCIANSTA